MSIKVIKWVFRQHMSPPDKLVLLAIAEHAHDDGTGAWPSVGSLAEETSLGRSTVQRSLRRLEASGFLSTEVGVGRRSSRYKIDLSREAPERGTRGPRAGHHMPQSGAQIVIEPSVEPKEGCPPGQRAPEDPAGLFVAPETKPGLASPNQRANTIARECLDRYPFNVFHGVRTAVGAALKGGVPDDTVRRALRALSERGDPISVNTLKVEINGGFKGTPAGPSAQDRRYGDTAPPARSDVFAPPGTARDEPNEAYRAMRASRRSA